jgi:hypothetical protein
MCGGKHITTTLAELFKEKEALSLWCTELALGEECTHLAVRAAVCWIKEEGERRRKV